MSRADGKIPISSLVISSNDQGRREVPKRPSITVYGQPSARPAYARDQSTPRAPRPSYSEQQKFFIMFARIIEDKSWPDIENDFCRVFGERTKGGLTSVYYRIRESWKMKKVLQNGPQAFDEDRSVVDQKARGFQDDFLRSIGYLN